MGHRGTSAIEAGVRIAQFSVKSAVDIYARPDVNKVFATYYNIVAQPSWNQYFLHGHAQRSFNGVGPSLSWNGSAAIAGNTQDGALMLDWGIEAAVLFGRQKAKTDQSTRAYHYATPRYHHVHYGTLYPATSHHSTRSRSVTVPNIGGFAGLSLKWPNAKLSIGYRYDTFLSAMDTGIDAAKKSDVTFNGPYASISIGIGD